jgi:SP family myo-inositol transporter-like MFS transporter 13
MQDTGIAAGMLVAIHQDLGHTLSSTEQEVIVSATTVGAIFGALVGGRLSDRLGRRKVMIMAGIFFTLGSMEQAASQVLRELILGRFLVGLGVGMSSMIVPTYLAECSPTSIRGQIISINSLLITGGQVIAYIVDAGFYNVAHGWRWMVLAGGLPALVQLIGLIFYLDESPRWLISQKQHVSARHILAKIYPLASQEAITKQVHRIEKSLQKDHGSSHTSTDDQSAAAGLALTEETAVKVSNLRNQLSILWNDQQNRKALFLACGLQAGQQLIGANSILYFSSRLLLMAGFHANPNLAAVSIAVANLIGTALALKLVDRIGRRRLLLNALAAAVVTLIGLSIALSQVSTNDVTDAAEVSPDPSGAGAWAYVSLIAVSNNR